MFAPFSNFVPEIFVGGWKALAFAPPHSLHLDEDLSSISKEEKGLMNSPQPGDLPDLPVRWMFPKCGDTETWNDRENKSESCPFVTCVPDAEIPAFVYLCRCTVSDEYRTWSDL
jgi:hypothetical protein